MSRTTSVLAGIAIVGVLAGATAMTLLGERDARFESEPVFQQSLGGPKSLKVYDWNGDKQDDVFAQGDGIVVVWDAKGTELYKATFPPGFATTLTDVNGDGRDDIVVASPAPAGVVLSVAAPGVPWRVQSTRVKDPQRIAAIHYASGTLVVVADDEGHIAGFKPGGDEVWATSYKFGAVAGTKYEIRGLDEARVDQAVLAVLATRDGAVVAFDEAGKVWYQSSLSSLRRMRTYDLDGDGKSEILVGGDEQGQLMVLGARDGAPRAVQSLGQPITEIRDAELDGNPSSREFVAGGKKGGVWAFGAAGNLLWSAQASDKVTDILSLDVQGDGKPEVLVGDDAGHLAILDGKTGAHAGTLPGGASIVRLDTGALGEIGRVALAAGTRVSVLTLLLVQAPVLYTPLVAGVAIALLILFAAWFVNTLPARTGIRLTAQDTSPEGLAARRRMLHENLADVERVRKAGEIPADAYLARVRGLREELAETNAALAKAGVSLKPEIFQCPRCGGPLPVGADRCDFCGQGVVL